MKEAHDHSRVSPEGKAAGKEMSRFAEMSVAILELEGEPDDRCKTCAFREGTVPNGCIQTQADAMKAVAEGVPFTCHQRPGWPCHGWYAIRTQMKGKKRKMPWPFSPPDNSLDSTARKE